MKVTELTLCHFFGSATRFELDRKGAQSTHDEPATPAQIARFSRKSQVRKAPQQGGKRGLPLQPGQRRPHAVVDAVPVSEVLIVTPREVQGVRIREPLRVAVGRRQHHQYGVPGGDLLAAQGQRLGGVPPGRHLDRPVEPEQFLDPGGQQRVLPAAREASSRARCSGWRRSA